MDKLIKATGCDDSNKLVDLWKEKAEDQEEVIKKLEEEQTRLSQFTSNTENCDASDFSAIRTDEWQVDKRLVDERIRLAKQKLDAINTYRKDVLEAESSTAELVAACDLKKSLEEERSVYEGYEYNVSDKVDPAYDKWGALGTFKLTTKFKRPCMFSEDDF